jgi:hypothetical protein
MFWLGGTLREGRWNELAWRKRWKMECDVDCFRDVLRGGSWSGLACWYVERCKVQWIGLDIRWKVAGEINCLRDRYVERWQVKWIDLLLRWETECKTDWVVDSLRGWRWNGLPRRYSGRLKVTWSGLEIRWEMAGEMIGLLICWEMAGAMDWLVDLLTGDSWKGVVWKEAERWNVERIGLEVTLWGGRWNELACWYVERWNVKCDYKYKQHIIKHNSSNDFIKVYFLHCFVQRQVSALVMSSLQVDYLVR